MHRTCSIRPEGWRLKQSSHSCAATGVGRYGNSCYKARFVAEGQALGKQLT